MQIEIKYYIMENRIAIVAVGYNRVNSIYRLLESLNSAKYEVDNIPLIISIDKSDTTVVEDYADSFQWNHGHKIVDKHETNLGLRDHMMSLRKWFDYYDALIVLADDIVVSPLFYFYVQQCYDRYSMCDDIAGISLYSFSVNYQKYEIFTPLKKEYDVYFMNCAMSWGQVWMKKQWMDFYKWYLKNQEFTYTDSIPLTLYKWPASSWLKYHTRYCIETDKYFVYPYVSYSTNYGDIGTHHRQSNTLFQVVIQLGNYKKLILPLLEGDSVRYDGFFENKKLYSILGLSEKECCIDLNGIRNGSGNKRYLLTTRRLNYKINRMYGVNYRPIELNVFFGNKGTDIYLYDTNVTIKNNSDSSQILLYRFYISSILFFLRKYGMKSFFREIFNNLRKKI